MARGRDEDRFLEFPARVTARDQLAASVSLAAGPFHGADSGRMEHVDLSVRDTGGTLSAWERPRSQIQAHLPGFQSLLFSVFRAIQPGRSPGRVAGVPVARRPGIGLFVVAYWGPDGSLPLKWTGGDREIVSLNKIPLTSSGSSFRKSRDR